MTSTIYILRCENDCYYIGSSNNFTQRLEQHKGTLLGSPDFTKQNKFLDIEKTIEVPKKLRLQIEHEVTLSYVQKYGIEKVAGGFLVSKPQRNKFVRDHIL